jgi:hypothetical protein
VAIALLLKFIGAGGELKVREYLEGDFGRRYPDSVAVVLREVELPPALAISAGQIAILRRRMLSS